MSVTVGVSVMVGVSVGVSVNVTVGVCVTVAVAVIVGVQMPRGSHGQASICAVSPSLARSSFEYTLLLTGVSVASGVAADAGNGLPARAPFSKY